MRKWLILLFIAGMFTFILAQEDAESNLKEIKKMETLTNKEVDEVKIEIRKPDNASLLSRKPTDFDLKQKFDVVSKIKKSNKLLY
ncbi:MAG: hypothetical protein JW996_04520 [Candidatus Cloacimonetes bacterium]|nr:hypothetical protein [Candidatus Cloacimonadota bacterium]